MRNLKASVVLLGLLATQSAMAQGTMMSGNMMGCPMGQQGMGLMHNADVTQSVVESADGVTVKWTASKPENVKALKEMAHHMEDMHSTATPATTESGKGG